MRELVFTLGKRLPWLLVLGGTVIALGLKLHRSGSHLEAAGVMFFVCALIIVMAIVVAWPLADFLAIPFASLFFPDRREVVEADYRLADYYLRELRFEEALGEYERFCRDHPRELTPWVLRIDLLLDKFRDLPAARRALIQGRLALLSRSRARQLQDHFNRSLARLS